MKNNEPNKIIKAINKDLKKLQKDSGGMADKYDYEAEKLIRERLIALIQVVGAIEVMSKNSLILLVALQGRLRVMPEHRFYVAFSRAAEDMNLI